MRLFLQLDTGDWRDSPYHKPLLHYASSLASDIIGAELDGESEATVADVMIRLCEDAESLFVFITAHGTTLGSLKKVLQHLATLSPKLHRVVISGENDAVASLLAPVREKLLVTTSEEEIKNEISLFCQGH
jgi:hypothetical protein